MTRISRSLAWESDSMTRESHSITGEWDSIPWELNSMTRKWHSITMEFKIQVGVTWFFGGSSSSFLSESIATHEPQSAFVAGMKIATTAAATARAWPRNAGCADAGQWPVR